MKHLSEEILDILIRKTGRKERTVRKNLSFIRRRFPTATLNACAQVFARQHGTSVLQKLDDEDKTSLPPSTDIPRPVVMRSSKTKAKRPPKSVFQYTSTNYFIQQHVDEINRAYNSKCLTSAYILIRKVLESLIIDLLRAQFPPTSLPNKELYYDVTQGRYKDFSAVLRNLFDRRSDFPTGLKKAIERLYMLTKDLKDNANDKTHSLYHIVTRKKELDELDLRTILELIMEIEKPLGLRS